MQKLQVGDRVGYQGSRPFGVLSTGIFYRIAQILDDGKYIRLGGIRGHWLTENFYLAEEEQTVTEDNLEPELTILEQFMNPLIDYFLITRECSNA